MPYRIAPLFATLALFACPSNTPEPKTPEPVAVAPSVGEAVAVAPSVGEAVAVEDAGAPAEAAEEDAGAAVEAAVAVEDAGAAVAVAAAVEDAGAPSQVEPVKAQVKTAPKKAGADPALISQGGELYAKHCKMCHGPDGTKTKVMGKEVTSLADPAYQAKTSNAQLSAIIAEGMGELYGSGKKPMPAFAQKLSTAEISAVVAFLRTLK